jgi:hypothetical protein
MSGKDEDFLEDKKRDNNPKKEAPPTTRRVTQKNKESQREHKLPTAMPLPGQLVASRNSKLASFRNTQGIQRRSRVNVKKDEESDYESEEDYNYYPDYESEEDSLDRQFDEYLAEQRNAREMNKTKKKPSFFSKVKRMLTKRKSNSKVGGKGSKKKRRKK